MRIEEVLGPPGELKDLAFPARRHPCMCMLSPDAARAVSPKVNVMNILGVLVFSWTSTQLLYLHNGHCYPAPCFEPGSQCYTLPNCRFTIHVSEFFPRKKERLGEFWMWVSVWKSANDVTKWKRTY